MDAAVEQKRLDKLARVRENQRKSRARRQDHLQDLERKVLGLQQELHLRDVQHRLAIQKLEAENRKLRDLHYRSGVPPDALDAYLQSIDNPVMAQKVAIPAVRQRSLGRSRETSCDKPCSSDRGSSCGGAGMNDLEPLVGASNTTKQEPEDGSKKGAQEARTVLPPFCACSPEEDLESLPVGERVLNTTLCAIAEKLVYQYNACGIDVSEIQQKLRRGFFRSSSEEGCRVQNQILFQVLDEISGQ
ncbi:hypothetical protein BDV18DRAFT_155300 [Aspergillus unguis]